MQISAIETPENFLDKYYKVSSNYNILKAVLNNVEQDIQLSRAENKIPIYATKCRIKTYDSSYLKTIRKEGRTSLLDITDFLGFRVLCLFEQDLIQTYEFLIKYLSNKAEKLSEVIIYHSENNSIYEEIFNNNLNKSKHSSIEFKYEPKLSGYQSIHFTGFFKADIDTEIVPFELQLRTLLQDVWGEVEHKIAYKQKNQQKFIKQSFALLARDLQTNDMLLSNLYDLVNEERDSDIDPIFRISYTFKYDNDKFPNIFTTNRNLNELYKEYESVVHDPMFIKDSNEVHLKAEGLYKDIVSFIYNSKNDIKIDSKLNYWIEMENAFYSLLLFNTKNSIDNALAIYIKYWKNSYVASFRLGQICLFLDKLSDAVKFFKYSLILSESELNKSSNKEDIYINKIKIHINLAFVYWINGEEFVKSMIDEVVESVKLLDKIAVEGTSIEKLLVYNSAAWYFMCTFMNNKLSEYARNKHSIELEEQFIDSCQKLEALIIDLEAEEKVHNKLYIGCEIYDTIAVCFYHLYLKFKKTDDIQRAHFYIEKARRSPLVHTTYSSAEEFIGGYYSVIVLEYNKIMKK